MTTEAQSEPVSDRVRRASKMIELMAWIRRSRVGFIFQNFGLIPILTAAENVEVPLRMVRTDPAGRRERSRVLLELVGLGDRAQHRPAELSGGEQQRVAIARALANGPRLLLADEPVSSIRAPARASLIYSMAWYGARGSARSSPPMTRPHSQSPTG